MKRIILSAIIISIIIQISNRQCIAQNWIPLNLDNGVGSSLYHLYADTSTDRLYASGTFTANPDNIYGGVAVWNGFTWDTLPNCQKWPTKFLVFKYLDTLYISGFYTFISPYINIAKWNGNIFDTIPGTSNMTVYCSTEKDGILYLGGAFKKCGNDSAYSLCKYDGNNFNPITPIYNGDAYILCMTFYKDTLYVGGNFYIHPQPLIAGLAKWDGYNLVQVNSEFSNVGCTIETMAVYKDELYIGGYFTKASGFTGDFIMKWNGHHFSEVGGGTNQRVTCMKVYNNELYVGGWFTEVGGSSCKNIAKWDGNNWTCLNQDDFNSFPCIRDIIIFNDELYIAGAFDKIGNDSIKQIAKYNHPLASVNENNYFDKGVKIYPNPATVIINFEGQILFVMAEVYDISGKRLLTKQLTAKQIDISNLAKGLYFIKLTTEEGSMVRKFVKE